MTRQEHLDWCKKRALEYVDAGNLVEAVTSMLSDLGKHPETKEHAGIKLGVGLLFVGALNDTQKVRHFIEGFH